MKNKRRISNKKIKLIVCASVAAAIILSLIITNIFIPVKYLGAYITFAKDKVPPDTLRIRYLDVGFGDSTLIEFPDGKTMLVDGGTGAYANVHKLLKVMNSSGIDKLDYLVCTSVKSEHCGSLSELLKYKPVGKVFIPEAANPRLTDEYAEFYAQLSEMHAETEIAKYGSGAYSPEFGYGFFFLSPSVVNARTEYDDMNDRPSDANIDSASAVMWLEYSGHGFLFLSDCGAAVQKKISNSFGAENGKYFLDGLEIEFSRCTVIKAANHCGKDTAVSELYDLIKPVAAIISVGRNARGCPSMEDLSILQLYVKNFILRTDLNGTITVTVSAGQYHITKEYQ